MRGLTWALEMLQAQTEYEYAEFVGQEDAALIQQLIVDMHDAHAQTQDEVERLRWQIVRLITLFGFPSTHVSYAYLDAVGDIIQEHLALSPMQLRDFRLLGQGIRERLS